MDRPVDEATQRKVLEAALTALRSEIAVGVQAPGQMTYGSQAAAATQVFEQQRDLALRDRSIARLEQVEAALARLDDGTYGACIGCQQSIPAERLEALPWASLCVRCQSAEKRR